MAADELRRCPWCAEWIQGPAKICRYCQREVEPVAEQGAPAVRSDIAVPTEAPEPPTGDSFASEAASAETRDHSTPPASAIEHGSPADPPAADAADEKLQGLGGWLGLFALACFIGPIVSVASVVSSWSKLTPVEWGLYKLYVPIAPFARGFEYVTTTVLAVGFLFLGVQLVREHKSAAFLAVTVLCCSLVFAVCDLTLAAWIRHSVQSLMGSSVRAGSSAASVDTYAGTIRGIVGSLVWLLYFVRSKRVRNTFGAVTLRRVGAWLAGLFRPEAPVRPADA